MDGGSHSSGDHDDTSMLDPAEEAKKDPKTKLREKNKRAQKRWVSAIHVQGCVQEGPGGPLSLAIAQCAGCCCSATHLEKKRHL